MEWEQDHSLSGENMYDFLMKYKTFREMYVETYDQHEIINLT